ncbi:tetratricopeptide repeat-containing sulfotransferase family protein [Jiella mangrovi]|uniref:Sulfotransferase n=1 Tax=Jiella mangrovi TaxID=2821407 RepID=A0ABS4BMT0_9HYPH|nr:sulfotransferase [Jiella mangrovi]MBP0618047.1 sulfotransferase [Jiella mangrovi]
MPAAALSPDLAIRKVKSFVKKGEVQKALVLCNQVLERYPGNRRIVDEVEAIGKRAGSVGENAVFLQAEIVKLASHYHAGRYGEVIRHGHVLLASAPSAALVHNLVGSAHQALGDLEEAAKSYHAALQIKPDYAEVVRSLGEVVLKLGRYGEALPLLDRAIALRGGEAETLTWRGDALAGLGRDDEAFAAYELALRRDPEHATAWNGRALCLERFGRIEEAVASLRRALDIIPDYIAARLNLGRVQTFSSGDFDLQQMEVWWNGADLSRDNRIILGFALGKAYDDIGETAKAFPVFAEANRLRREAIGYDISIHERLVASIVALQRQRLCDSAKWFVPHDTLARRPIFIIGMPRSGTSLAEQILASHSGVFGAGETSAVERAVKPVFAQLASGDVETRRRGLRAIRDRYNGFLAGLNTDAPFVTDKMPINFLWAGAIRAAFPEAILIHTARDAAAVCFSNFKHNFSDDGLGFCLDLRDVARFHRLHDALMSFWHETMPGAIYPLDYEALTENQEDETRALLAHCGLEFEDACLEFHATSRVVRTASARQVRQKMYQGSSKAWRAYEADLAPMLEILAAPMPRL